MNGWNIFTSVYDTFDVAFLAAVQGMIANLVAYVHGPLLAGIIAYVAGMLLLDMFDPAGGESGMKIVQLLMRGAIVYFAVSTVGTYDQYFTNLFLTILPQDLGNAIAGATGGPPLNAASFDAVWNTAWAAAEFVYKAIPAWSLKGVFLSLIVFIYIGVALFAIGFAFLVYMGSHIVVGLLIATGPIFVCLWLWQRTAKMADAWVGSMAAGVLLQFFSLALLTVLVATIGQMVQRLAAAGGGAGNAASNVMSQVQVLVEAGFLLFVCAYLAKEIAQHAGHIAGGVAHSVEPYTNLVYSAVSTAAKPAVSAAGSAAGSVTQVGRRVETSIYPAGRSLG